jgi:hypothetical protein
MNTQFDIAAEQWLRKHRYTEDAEVLSRISQRVQDLLEQNGGYVSTAHFERAYLGLVNEGAIKPFRDPLDLQSGSAAAIPQDVVDFIESPRTSAREMERRYRSDQSFRTQYDLYDKTKRQAQEQQGVVLTAEEYHRIPASTIVARYQRDRSFRIAVDKLISEGRI